MSCMTNRQCCFDKYGFTYERCPGCKTLFVNPRPVISAFERYYTESPHQNFGQMSFTSKPPHHGGLCYGNLRRARSKLLDNYATGHLSVIDIGGGFGLFAEAFHEVSGYAAADY